MKQNRHSLMAKGIMVLLSLLVLIFALTYAWFTDGNLPATANSFSVTASSKVDFDLAIGLRNADTGDEYVVSDYGKEFNLSSIPANNGTDHYDIQVGYSPLDVTGNGSFLYIPPLSDNDTNGRREVRTGEGESRYTPVEPNREYLSFDMIFKCQKEVNVYLDTGSVVLATCETTPGDGSLTANNAPRMSAYGNFSQDSVVGALRIGFVGYTDLTASDFTSNAETTEKMNNAADFVWLPRPDLYLDDRYEATGTKQTTGWVLHTAHDDQDFYTTYTDTKIHSYWDYQNQQTVSMTNNTVWDPSTDVRSIVHVGTPVTTTAEVGGETVTTTLYYGKVRVNIWIEGTDPEARRAIAGGKFNVSFDLRAS